MDNTVELLKVYIALNAGNIVVSYPFGRSSSVIDVEFFGGSVFADPSERQPMVIRCTETQLNNAKTEYFFANHTAMAKALQKTYRAEMKKADEQEAYSRNLSRMRKQNSDDLDALMEDLGIQVSKLFGK